PGLPSGRRDQHLDPTHRSSIPVPDSNSKQRTARLVLVSPSSPWFHHQPGEWWSVRSPHREWHRKCEAAGGGAYRAGAHLTPAVSESRFVAAGSVSNDA